MPRGVLWEKEETKEAFKMLSNGKTYEEIGKILGRTEFAVKKHIGKERKRQSVKIDDEMAYDIRHLFKDVEKSKKSDYKDVDAVNFKRFMIALKCKIEKEKMLYSKKVVYHNENYIVVDLGKYRKTLSYNEIYEKMKCRVGE